VSTARVSIRPKTWRGEEGFLISGRDTRDRQVSIFTTTRGSAEHIRDRVKAGHDITSADFEPREEEAKPYTRKDHRLAAAAEDAVRRGEAGALDDPDTMPLCTLQRLTDAFAGDKPPRVVGDPQRVIDLLHAYRRRLAHTDETAGRLDEVEAVLVVMQKAATIPTAIYERYLETHGWEHTDLRLQADLSGWDKPDTHYPGAGCVGVSLPLHEETWDSMFGALLADRPNRLYNVLRAIAAVEERPVDVVLADLLELAKPVTVAYPEHEKLRALRCPGAPDDPYAGHNYVVGRFVEWLGEAGYVIARWRPAFCTKCERPWEPDEDGSCPACGAADYRRSEDQLVPAFRGVEPLLHEHYGIDPERLDDEKRAMLAAARGVHAVAG
jgi:hypothetical protein